MKSNFNPKHSSNVYRVSTDGTHGKTVATRCWSVVNGAYVTHFIRDVLMFAMLSEVGKGGSYVRFFMTHTEIIIVA